MIWDVIAWIALCIVAFCVLFVLHRRIVLEMGIIV